MTDAVLPSMRPPIETALTERNLGDTTAFVHRRVATLPKVVSDTEIDVSVDDVIFGDSFHNGGVVARSAAADSGPTGLRGMAQSRRCASGWRRWKSPPRTSGGQTSSRAGAL